MDIMYIMDGDFLRISSPFYFITRSTSMGKYWNNAKKPFIFSVQDPESKKNGSIKCLFVCLFVVKKFSALHLYVIRWEGKFFLEIGKQAPKRIGHIPGIKICWEGGWISENQQLTLD